MLPAKPPQAVGEPLLPETIGVASIGIPNGAPSFMLVMALVQWSKLHPHAELHRWRQVPQKLLPIEKRFISVTFATFCELTDHAMFAHELDVVVALRRPHMQPGTMVYADDLHYAIMLLRDQLSVVFTGFGRLPPPL